MIDLNELRRLHAAAKKGEFEANHFGIAAHNAMPALLDELESLRKEAAEHEYYLDRLTEQVTKYLGKKPYSLPEGIDELGKRIAELENYKADETVRRAKADAYDRICQHLGVTSNALRRIAELEKR